MRFKKTKPISQKPADPDALELADIMVLKTEDKSRFIALYRDYFEEYRPENRTQRDLVEEMVCARWRQRRCAMLQTAILNITMERNEEYVARAFGHANNATVTALACIDEDKSSAALTRITREEAAHTRAFHRALKLLRELQKQKLPNEPKPGLTLVPAMPCNDEPKGDSGPEITGHRPLAT